MTCESRSDKEWENGARNTYRKMSCLDRAFQIAAAPQHRLGLLFRGDSSVPVLGNIRTMGVYTRPVSMDHCIGT